MNIHKKTIICSMIKNGDIHRTIQEKTEAAFQHFVDNVYRELKPSDYKEKLKHLVSKFNRNGLSNGTGSLGMTKALEILQDFNYLITVDYPTKENAIQYFESHNKSGEVEKVDNSDLKQRVNELLNDLNID